MNTAIVASDGTIWIAASNGLYRFMYPFRLEYWDKDEGVEPSVYSLLRTGNRMYAGGFSGIAALSGDRGKWTELPGSQKLDGPGSLTPGPEGTIFSSTWKGVVQIMSNGEILRSGPPVRMGLMARDSDGKVFVGGVVNDKGVGRVVIRGRHLLIRTENVPSDSVSDIKYDDKRSTMWACDGNEPLFKRGLEDWRRISPSDGLRGIGCQIIAIQPNSDLWVGYSHSSVALITNPTSDHPVIKTFAIDMERQGSNTLILDIDAHGGIWRCTSACYLASSAEATAGEWLRLDEQDGFFVPNGHAFWRDSDGSVWFGSATKIMHFSPPENFVTDFPVPNFSLAGFDLGDGKALFSDAVNIVPHASNLTAHIGSVQFDRRNGLRFRWRLLPEESKWQTASSFDIPLGKLSWGVHKLEAQAQLMDGPWSETAAKSFRVLLPVWLSWPALLIYAAAGGSGAAGTYNWQKKRRRRAAKILPTLDEFRLAALSPDLAQLHGSVLESRFEVGRVLRPAGQHQDRRADQGLDGRVPGEAAEKYRIGRAALASTFEPVFQQATCIRCHDRYG
jgi:hypothetical protein